MANQAFRIQPSAARERLVSCAYELFIRQGINRVGIDLILTESGTAKASLYKHFKSKTDLTLAVLERRGELWTRDWLIAGVRRRARTPGERLLKIFDLFHEWFQQADFEGCFFMKVRLETDPKSREHRAAVRHAMAIRTFVRSEIEGCGCTKPAQCAAAWLALMEGSISAAGVGEARAALDAKQAAKLLLEHWPRA